MISNFSIHNKHLLIVDDNVTNIILIQAILQEAGFNNIHTAISAVEAYSVLKKEPVNAILMDISMPDIDGLEAVKTIKANPEYSQIPIIMVTAIDDDESLKKSFELGAVDFVRKPVNQVELISRLTTILESQEKDGLIVQHSRFTVMEEIIGMLAHQWRQPLSIISAIIGTLQTQKALEVLSDEELKNSLQKMSDHTKELSEMITTFREFFKTDAPPVIASPNEAIYEAQTLMRETLKQKGIELKLELTDVDIVSYVQNLLVQVLTNLLTNSKEAFERNEVESPEITIRSFMKDYKIYISVEDNAGGIDEETIKHIFEPYFTTKEEKNGKGLGLFIAKSILKQQFQGNISVTSQDGKTVFLIMIDL